LLTNGATNFDNNIGRLKKKGFECHQLGNATLLSFIFPMRQITIYN